MNSVFLSGLNRWLDRERNKVFHYRNILKKSNLKSAEKEVIENRVKELNELVKEIEKVCDRGDKRKARTGEEVKSEEL